MRYCKRVNYLLSNLQTVFHFYKLWGHGIIFLCDCHKKIAWKNLWVSHSKIILFCNIFSRKVCCRQHAAKSNLLGFAGCCDQQKLMLQSSIGENPLCRHIVKHISETHFTCYSVNDLKKKKLLDYSGTFKNAPKIRAKITYAIYLKESNFKTQTIW